MTLGIAGSSSIVWHALLPPPLSGQAVYSMASVKVPCRCVDAGSQLTCFWYISGVFPLALQFLHTAVSVKYEHVSTTYQMAQLEINVLFPGIALPIGARQDKQVNVFVTKPIRPPVVGVAIVTTRVWSPATGNLDVLELSWAHLDPSSTYEVSWPCLPR